MKIDLLEETITKALLIKFSAVDIVRKEGRDVVHRRLQVDLPVQAFQHWWNVAGIGLYDDK